MSSMDAAKAGETWLVVASTGAALVNLVAATVTGLERYDRIGLQTRCSRPFRETGSRTGCWCGRTRRCRAPRRA